MRVRPNKARDAIRALAAEGKTDDELLAMGFNLRAIQCAKGIKKNSPKKSKYMPPPPNIGGIGRSSGVRCIYCGYFIDLDSTVLVSMKTCRGCKERIEVNRVRNGVRKV